LNAEQVFDADLKVRVYDLTGRLVLETFWPARTQTLEIKALDWPSGTYSVRIGNDSPQVLRAVKI
jgi:hypothetical protein